MLHSLVQKGDVNSLSKALSSHDPNARDQYQQTPLHVACLENKAEIAELLLKKRAHVNVQDRNGWTPLHCCASNGHLETCKLLLENRYGEAIDVASLNKDGTSALHYLVRLGSPRKPELYLEVMELMVKRGAELNTQTKHGEAPLHQCCLRGNDVATEFLLSHHANVNIHNKRGETALHYAVRTEQKKIIEILMKYEADPTIRSEDGTPLDIASSFELVNLLQNATVPRRASSDVRLASHESHATTTKLRIKIVRATLRRELKNDNSESKRDSAISNIYCQILFNKCKGNTEVKSNTTSPKWHEVFDFPMKEFNTPMKICIFEKLPHKDDVLGQLTVPLSDVDLRVDVLQKKAITWKKRKRTGRVIGKLRIELGYILVAEATSDSRRNQSSGRHGLTKVGEASTSSGAFGWNRGKCTVPDCDCDIYQKEHERGGPCMNCGHYPAKHQKLGKLDPDSQNQEDLKLTSKDKSLAAIASAFGDAGNHEMSHTWEIDAQEIKFTKRLGEGTSAKVFRGIYRGQEVAIKVLKEKVNEKDMDGFLKEFAIMSSLRSPHVVYFYGACIKPSLCMVLEYCSKGSLFDCLSDPDENITWSRVLKIASDMLKGLNCLHSWKPQIVHRDLKSLNLLVDDNWTTKVCDFGLSRFAETSNAATLNKLRGTYAYCAPEVYFGQTYSPKSDVFSIGVILWELVYRCIFREYQQPYSEFDNLNFDFQIIIQTAKKDLRPTLPERCPKDLSVVISSCWAKEPDKRPLTHEVLSAIHQLQRHYESNRSEWDACIIPEEESESEEEDEDEAELEEDEDSDTDDKHDPPTLDSEDSSSRDTLEVGSPPGSPDTHSQVENHINEDGVSAGTPTSPGEPESDISEPLSV